MGENKAIKKREGWSHHDHQNKVPEYRQLFQLPFPALCFRRALEYAWPASPVTRTASSKSNNADEWIGGYLREHFSNTHHLGGRLQPDISSKPQPPPTA
jgi:hypothetical protein